jgi:hypothetical protein
MPARGIERIVSRQFSQVEIPCGDIESQVRGKVSGNCLEACPWMEHVQVSSFCGVLPLLFGAAPRNK